MTIQLPAVGTALAALLAAAVVALISTPVVRSLAFRVGAVDVPKDNRRMHKVPIPRLGGLAIFIAFLFSVISNTFPTKADGAVISLKVSLKYALFLSSFIAMPPLICLLNIVLLVKVWSELLIR